MPQHVLLALSDESLRGTYRHFLDHHGLAADVAADGLECLAKLRQSPPVLLVLDPELLWGGADGVLARMQEQSELALIPVIVLSANFHGRAHPGLRHVHYWRRPVLPRILFRMIHRLLPQYAALEGC